MNSYSVFMTLATSVAAADFGVVQEISGDTTLYTFSIMVTIFGCVVGLLLGTVGAGVIWHTGLSLAKKGWIGWFLLGLGVLVVIFFVAATPKMYVKLSPREIEIGGTGPVHILPLVDINRIETFRVRRARARFGYETHFKFHLRDGTQPDFTGSLVGAAVEQLAKTGRFAPINSGAPAVAAGPPATAPTAPTVPVVPSVAERPDIRPQRDPPAGKQPEVAAIPPVAAKNATEIDRAANGQVLAARFFHWLRSAERVTKALTQLTDGSAHDSVAIRRLDSSTTLLVDQAASVLQNLSSPDPDEAISIDLLPATTRRQIVELNHALLAEVGRLRELASPELESSGLLARLDRCVLPAWFIEGRSPTTEERNARPVAVDGEPGERRVGKRSRDFREEASRAMTFNKQRDAVALLRAALLASDDKTILEGVKWSPALKRPLMLLQWAFGVETKGFPGAGPANLRPQAGLAEKQERNNAAEMRLRKQLTTLTGSVGDWLYKGLQNRVESEGFGAWGHDSRGGSFEHRGIMLLEVAPVESLIESARSQKADALMAILLTSSVNEKGKATITAVAQLYDVGSGHKLWESKSLTNTKILAGLKQGKDWAAEFAGLALKFIDDEIVLREVPELPTELVQRRLAAIDSSVQSDPLGSLIELRYYQLTRHVEDAEAQQRLVKILGEADAKLLLAEDVQDRRNSVEKFVPAGK